MGVFKRALVQVKANIGKTILLVLIFLMTMGAVTSSFIVTRTYNKTLQETFKDGNVPVDVYPDYDQSITGGISIDVDEEMPSVTYEQYEEMAKLDTVESAKKSIGTMISGEGVLSLTSELENLGYYGYTVEFQKDAKTFDGYTDADALKFDIDNDAFNADPNSVVINNEILAANNLAIGDKITLDLNSEGTEAIEELANQEFTIVGSYSVTPTQAMIDEENKYAEEYDGYEPDLSFGNYKTKLIMPYAKGEELLKLVDYNVDAAQYWTTYYLKSLEDKEQFKADAEEIAGIPLAVDFSYYETRSESMETAEALGNLSYLQMRLKPILKVGAIIIFVLLTVIITMFIRGRKKEIGILVALGETKRNIYVQLLTEQLITLGVAILIEYPIVSIYLNSVAKSNKVLPLGFDLIPFGQSLLTGVIIVGVITIIPAIYTLRLKPKKILL